MRACSWAAGIVLEFEVGGCQEQVEVRQLYLCRASGVNSRTTRLSVAICERYSKDHKDYSNSRCSSRMESS